MGKHPAVSTSIPPTSGGEGEGTPGLEASEGLPVPRLASHMEAILRLLGVDLTDPNLVGTPERVARLYWEMFQGLRAGAEPDITTFPNQEGYSSLVLERDIPFYSLCAHHLVPFYGHAHIAYIPGPRLVGLSKLPRILEFYAKRPQLQERLTQQVVDYLWTKLSPRGAMVVLEARHLCVEMRGAKKPGALTVTSALRGCFEDREVQAEFLAYLERPRTW